MTDRDLLIRTVFDLFKRNCPLVGRIRAAESDLRLRLWKEVVLADLATLGVPESRGGAGGSLADACAAIRAASQFAPPIPLVENQLAAWLVSEAGLVVPEGPLTIGPTEFDHPVSINGSRAVLQGTVRRVPFAGAAKHLVLLIEKQGEGHVAIIDLAQTSIVPQDSLAGEPTGTVLLDGISPEAIAPTAIVLEQLLARAALARAQQIAGAMQRVLELSVIYAGERIQFGRPISTFQAIQHHLAVLAAETTAAAMAAETAVELAESGPLIEAGAIAKSRAGLAARATAIAHQIHGAIGVTEEHPLQLFTRRIWDWRDDFGSDVEWSTRLGRMVAAKGGRRLWETVATFP